MPRKRPAPAKDLTLNEQAQEILRIAREHGVEQNFFFITTFKRYQVQMTILADLEKRLDQDELLVTKEYVKGRQNLYANPAIGEYNRTADSANRTVATLLRIILSLRPEGGEDDELLKFIGRRR